MMLRRVSENIDGYYDDLKKFAISSCLNISVSFAVGYCFYWMISQ